MDILDLMLVLLAMGAAAWFLVRRWRRNLTRSLDPDLPACCAGCSGCASAKPEALGAPACPENDPNRS